MKMSKAVLMGMAAVFLSTVLQAAVVDRIVAVVNNEVITLSEFNNAFEPLQAKLGNSQKGSDRERTIRETKIALLNRLIDNLLIEQEARKSGIEVPDREVTDAIGDMQ